MNSERIIKQIEMYSNAIVAFTVLQALTYSYSFGTSAMFNCLVKTAANLAVGLTVLFIVITFLSVVAVMFLGRTMHQLSGEFGPIIQTIYRAKLIVVIVFSLLPVAITVGYGVRDYPSKFECKTIKKTVSAPVSPPVSFEVNSRPRLTMV
ncbi:MAG: hypothetical protein U1F76_00210 [Candidatus Competibacteraceae bacterium]